MRKGLTRCNVGYILRKKLTKPTDTLDSFNKVLRAKFVEASDVNELP